MPTRKPEDRWRHMWSLGGPKTRLLLVVAAVSAIGAGVSFYLYMPFIAYAYLVASVFCLLVAEALIDRD